MSEIILDVRNVSKSYKNSRREVKVLSGVDLSVRKGLMYGIRGDSGCGKSTLLSIMAGLQKPDSGEIVYDNTDISKLDEKELAILRRHDIVYISQYQDVIPELTVSENVRIVDCFDGKETGGGVHAADDILESLGIKELRDEMPVNLSGGELRRLTIARALYASPVVMILDEPTSNLDASNKDAVIGILKKLSSQGITVIAATHDDAMCECFDEYYTFI